MKFNLCFILPLLKSRTRINIHILIIGITNSQKTQEWIQPTLDFLSHYFYLACYEAAKTKAAICFLDSPSMLHSHVSWPTNVPHGLKCACITSLEGNEMNLIV